MTEKFNVLTPEEYKKLKDAISIITVYIAGADGKIENHELEWADKVTKIRSYHLPEQLANFFSSVGEDFQERLDFYINELPSDVKERNAAAQALLAELNPILAKLDSDMGEKLYKSFKSFAKHVAKSSGGMFGFFSIGPEESALLELEMINPIEHKNS